MSRAAAQNCSSRCGSIFSAPALRTPVDVATELTAFRSLTGSTPSNYRATVLGRSPSKISPLENGPPLADPLVQSKISTPRRTFSVVATKDPKPLRRRQLPCVGEQRRCTVHEPDVQIGNFGLI